MYSIAHDAEAVHLRIDSPGIVPPGKRQKKAPVPGCCHKAEQKADTAPAVNGASYTFSNQFAKHRLHLFAFEYLKKQSHDSRGKYGEQRKEDYGLDGD